MYNFRCITVGSTQSVQRIYIANIMIAESTITFETTFIISEQVFVTLLYTALLIAASAQASTRHTNGSQRRGINKAKSNGRVIAPKVTAQLRHRMLRTLPEPLFSLLPAAMLFKVLVEVVEHPCPNDLAGVAAVDRMVHVGEYKHVAHDAEALECRNEL